VTFDATAQVQFAAEFALFLVALAGLAIVALRSELLTRSVGLRAVLAFGFAALGGSAFVHGSLIVERSDNAALVLVRAIGWAAIAVGIMRWEGRPLSRQAAGTAVVTGLAGTLLVAILGDGNGAGLVGAALQAVGALAFGVALLAVSRKSIAARVAASSAATLLLVVLVLSVGLSAVLSNNVEDQAVASLDSRAEREANAIEATTRELITRAGLAVSGLTDRRADVLGAIAAQHAVRQDQAGTVRQFLSSLSDNLFGEVGLAYVDQGVGVVAAAKLADRDAIAILGSSAVQEVLHTASARGAVQVFGHDAFAVGAAPVVVNLADGTKAVAAVVAATKLDRTYLEVRATTDERVALALRSRTGLIARSPGAQPGVGVIARLADDVLRGDARAVDVTDDRFVAAKAVRNVDDPVLALVASRPTTAVDTIRENLFRTFFVIAFGGALLALLLAALVGDRIGAGIRLLTRSAEELQQGNLGARSGIRSDDEVGRLGSAFDEMASSIEDKTDALRDAAENEARLRNRVEAIVAGMGEALIALDDAGEVTDFNAAAEELIGMRAMIARGRPLTEVLRATTEDGRDVASQVLARRDARWSAVGDVDGAEGPVPAAITSSPLRGPEGGLAGRVLVLRDLRSEREVERMKREFLSRVGHELRTPLTPLLGYSRLLSTRELPPEKAREMARSMVQSGERLERIVEMLEFVASAEAGRAVLHTEPVDVRDVLDTVIGQPPAHAANGHVLSRRVARGTPRVVADPYWLRRSVAELVDNAVKFSPGGGKVVVTAAPDGDGNVEIAVRDNGVGMDAEEVERAFAEWVQGDESDTRAYGGLGLGLALVQRVVERHGGRVTCETAPGKGSKFSIVLPAVPTEGGDVGSSRPRARGAAGGRGGRGDDGGVPGPRARPGRGAAGPR
jgi:PAS domain S-box-containing protein